MYIPKSVKVGETTVNGVLQQIRSYRHEARKQKIKRLFENKKAT